MYLKTPIKGTPKYCPRCGQTKGRSEFYRNKSAYDGLQGWCKDCRGAYQQSASYKATQLRYRLTDEGRKVRRLARRRWQKTESYRTARGRYAAKHPTKLAARHQVGYGVEHGKLSAPTQCAVCAVAGEVEAHHPDYSKPLEVLWVCPACHRKIHEEPSC